MKQTLYFLVLILGGCSASNPTRPTVHTDAAALPTPQLSDKEKIALLRAEAHKRGLKWSISCEGDYFHDPAKKFFAEAKHKSNPDLAHYIEDGALPWWGAFGGTQAEAAYNLYQEIQQPEGQQPEHRPHEPDRKMCPPELRGN